jgi:Na+/H+-dicarboxylate symporter
MKNKLTYWILAGLIGGIIAGAIVNHLFHNDPSSLQLYIDNTKLGSYVFLKLIKLIIGPLVLSTLVVGVANIGDAKSVGRMGVKTIAWFVFASLMSLTLGLVLVNTLQPGAAFGLFGVACSARKKKCRRSGLAQLRAGTRGAIGRVVRCLGLCRLLAAGQGGGLAEIGF